MLPAAATGERLPMTKSGTAKPGLLAYILTELSIAGFMVFRVIETLSEKNIRIVLIIITASPVCMALIALIHYRRRFINESFFIPLTVYTIHAISSFATSSFFFFFPVCLGICCIAALFFNPRSLRNYIAVTNLVSVILILSGSILPHHTRAMLTSEMMMLWYISFFGSVFIYMITVFASDKNKAAQKAHDSFTAHLATNPNRIVLVDSLNQVMYISNAFLDITTVKDPALAVGRPILDLFRNDATRDLFYAILTGPETFSGIREVMINGKRCYLEIITNLLTDEIQGKVINLIDITPVMIAKLEAEAASRSKSDFLATMSHEIRTPLNAIIGLSEIELQRKLLPETRQDLEKIHNSGSSLLSIINDILDISKIEAGSFELVPADYDVPSLVNDTIYLNVVRIGSKQIVFKLNIDPAIPSKLHGDEVRVKQVLNNLLSNAIKYTKEGTVSLNITWERRENNAWMHFTVHDTGRGIRQEDLSRLFSEYAQFDIQANHHIEGTGLGLSITKNLVELMGGTISVESEYGRGSVFTVIIPQPIVDETAIGETTAKSLELFRFMDTRRTRSLNLIRLYMPYGKVLVVDDVETNLDVVKGLLLPYGLYIDCASSGQEAIAKIRAACDGSGPLYDLVLMDHMMPVMDGIEAVRIIRGLDSDYARNVPVVALTANALAGNEEMFLSHGFNAFISKPIDIMQLDTALNTWIRNRQDRETLIKAEQEKAACAENESGRGRRLLDGVLVDGVDLETGRDRYNGEKAYLDVLRSYCVHTPPLLEKLRTFSGERNLADYTVQVHGLKGASYGICANTAGREAEALEQAARAGDLKRVLADTVPFIEKMELLLQDLGALLRTSAAARETGQKLPAPEDALLKKLLEAVKHYRASVMEEVMAELESHDYETGGDLVVWLREQMDTLEYDAIRERLEQAQFA
jgi:signal transduction histidine kinase/CheY-like chemotaxis protein